MIVRVLTFAVLALAVLLLTQHLLGQGDQREAGKPIVDVKLPVLSSLEQQGKQLFDGNCASCHGQNAAGQYGVAPPLVHIIYEPNHHGDGSFQLAAKQGVRQHHWQFGNMPPVPNVTPDDVTKITAYVRGLQRANGVN